MSYMHGYSIYHKHEDGHTIAGRRPFVTIGRFFCLSFKRPYTHYLL